MQRFKDESLFSLSDNIYPNWLMKQPRKISSSHELEYVPVSATGWLIAAYIFAILCGLLGITFCISVYFLHVRPKISMNPKVGHTISAT